MIVTQQIDIKFKIKNTNYGVTANGRIFNLKRGNELKKTVVGTTIGYCINGKFKSLKTLRKHIEQIKINDCPF